VIIREKSRFSGLGELSDLGGVGGMNHRPAAPGG
jgi:hypothetical protein